LGVSAIDDHVPMVTVVIDVANVMGARPDGWWRDRAGAALRLCREVAALAARGVPAGQLPGGAAGAGGAGPDGASVPAVWVVVLEGRARDAAADCAAAAMATAAQAARVRVVSAPGSGDDAIVDEVVSAGGECLVVTADRELRRRCAAAGAAVAGPGWLLGMLACG
jgi:hypothetical protein